MKKGDQDGLETRKESKGEKKSKKEEQGKQKVKKGA